MPRHCFNLGYDNLNEKLFGVAQGSSWARQYDLFTGLNIISENPWLGIGFEVNRYLEASGRLGFEDTLLTETQLAERPTSNGVIQLFYSLGIPLGLVFVFGVMRQRLFQHRGLIAAWPLLVHVRRSTAVHAVFPDFHLQRISIDAKSAPCTASREQMGDGSRPKA